MKIHTVQQVPAFLPRRAVKFMALTLMLLPMATWRCFASFTGNAVVCKGLLCDVAAVLGNGPHDFVKDAILRNLHSEASASDRLNSPTVFIAHSEADVTTSKVQH